MLKSDAIEYDMEFLLGITSPKQMFVGLED